MSAACEQVLFTGEPCGNAAHWLVGAGSRRSDRQLSCGRCLSRTCDLFNHMGDRALTVVPVSRAALAELAAARGHETEEEGNA